MHKKTIIAATSISVILATTLGGIFYLSKSKDFYGDYDVKLKDIPGVKLDDSETYNENQISYSTERVKQYDKVQLEGYEVKSFDKKDRFYTVDFTIKNISEDVIKGLKGEITLFGFNGGYSLGEISVDKDLNAGDTYIYTSKVSESELAYTSFHDEIEDEADTTVLAQAVADAIKEETFHGEFQYNYDGLGEDTVINHSIGFDGEIYNKSIYLFRTNDIKEVEDTREPGLYLGLYDFDKKKLLDGVVAQHIEILTDEFNDLAISATFKNEGDKPIKNFMFNPSMTILGYDATPGLRDDSYYDSIIQPGEEFSFTVLLSLSDISLPTDLLDEERAKWIPYLISSKPLSISLLEDRLLDFRYNYTYDCENHSTETDIEFASNGVLKSLDVHEEEIEPSIENDTEIELDKNID